MVIFRRIAISAILSLFLNTLVFFDPSRWADAAHGSVSTIPMEFTEGTTPEGAVVLDPALLTRTKSTSTSNKKSIIQSSGSAPYTVTGTLADGSTYQYLTYTTYSGNQLFEGKDVTASNTASTFNIDANQSSAGQTNKVGSRTLTTRTGVYKLSSNKSSISGSSGSNIAPYSSMFGPEIWSQPFSATSSQAVSFDWAATDQTDDYEIYAFLVKVSDTVGCSTSDYGTVASHELMAYGRGSFQDWTTAAKQITANGCYRFRFVAGTFDATGGLAVGGILYVDNAVILGKAQTITFPQPNDVIDSASVTIQYETLTATTSATDAVDSTLQWTSYTTSVCAVRASTGDSTKGEVTFTGTRGECTIIVSGARTATFAAAEPVSRTFSLIAAATSPSGNSSSSISGDPETCALLTANLGTWQTGGEPITSTTYQWKTSSTSSGTYTDIAGATSSTYTTTSADLGRFIKVTITRTNSVGSGSETTNTPIEIVSTGVGCVEEAPVPPQSVSCAVPSIVSISPQSVSMQGGERVTLQGNNLTSQIYVDGVQADVRLSSSQQIVFVSRSRAAGIASVTVQGCSGMASAILNIDGNPQVSNYFPSTGSTEGGTVVRITGQQLSGATVKVGLADAVIHSNSATELRITTPTGKLGPTKIRIVTPTGVFELDYLYVEPPSFKEFSQPYIQESSPASFLIGTLNAESISLTQGKLPPGLSLATPLGTISGVALASGSFNFFLTAAGAGGAVSQEFTIIVDKPTPGDRRFSLPLVFNQALPTDEYQSRLKNFFEEIRSVSPSTPLPRIELTGGSQTTSRYTGANQLAEIRHAMVLSHASRAQLAWLNISSNFCSGEPNRIEILVSWDANMSSSTSCKNIETPIEQSAPEGSKSGVLEPTESQSPSVMDKQAKTLTLRVFFDMGVSSLDRKQKLRIEKFISQVNDTLSNPSINVFGYAQPTRGTESTDPRLSRERAQYVAGFIESNFNLAINRVQGKGRTEENNARSRFVEIVVRQVNKG